MALFSFGSGKDNGSNGNGHGAEAPAGGVAVAPPPPAMPAAPPPTVTPERQAYLTQMRVKIHQKLVERLNVQNLRSMPINVVRQEVRTLIRELYQSEKGLLSSAEQAKLMDDVMDETFGLGPLEGLLKDPTITDILVNRFDKVYVERRGQLELTEVSFRDNAHLRQIIDRIVVQVGRRVDEISPMVDARLPDGSRVNAIIPPLALDGPAMSIRRFGHSPLTIQELVSYGSIPPVVLEFIAAAVQARCNVLISGGTGSGKTTLLNCLSRYIPPQERIITIEDAAELQLQQPHTVRLETRPPNIEGAGEVTQRDLVRNSLRMRPDRIIIGEVRGGEAVDMLQAMNTGHEGSMTTIHANSPRDALSRLEVTVSMSGLDIPTRALRQQISSALHIVIQAQRMMGGRRKIVSVCELTGMEGDQIQMHELFVFEQTGVDENGHATGRFVATGIRPRVVTRIEHAGMKLPPEWFARRVIQ
jgi:pilus assembly protein CpaF